VFTVGEDDADITVGEIEAVIKAKLGAIPVNLTATCSPPADNVLTTVKVEKEEVDEVAPVITLKGDNPMELEVGDKYEEPGATAQDDVDGDVTDAIKISGEVNTDKAGTYEVVYTVSDAAGNEATETRVVNVVETDNGEEPGNGDGEEPGDGDGEEPGNGDGEEPGDGKTGEDGKPGEDGKRGEEGKPGED